MSSGWLENWEARQEGAAGRPWCGGQRICNEMFKALLHKSQNILNLPWGHKIQGCPSIPMETGVALSISSPGAMHVNVSEGERVYVCCARAVCSVHGCLLSPTSLSPVYPSIKDGSFWAVHRSPVVPLFEGASSVIPPPLKHLFIT